MDLTIINHIEFFGYVVNNCGPLFSTCQGCALVQVLVDLRKLYVLSKPSNLMTAKRAIEQTTKVSSLLK